MIMILHRVFGRVLLVGCVVAGLSLATTAAAVDSPARVPGRVRGGGESQIDESSPDESAPTAGRSGAASDLAIRLREYVEGSLSRYDALKSESAGFRRQGWFPSIFLRDPERDVVLASGDGGAIAVTVHLSCAHRDLEQRLVIAPAERFELPGADKRFFSELLGALATIAPQIDRVRLHFWFGVLRADGRMTWESRGGIGLRAAAVRKFPEGSRTEAAVWPLLEENTLSPLVWPP